MNKPDENLNIVPSGYRILLTFYILLKTQLNQKSLNEALQKDPLIEKTFTKEALLKFINTLKTADIDITKEKNFYKVNKLPWKFKLSQKNIETILKLQTFVSSLYQDELEKDYDCFLRNLLKYSETDFPLPDKKNTDKTYSKYSSLIKKIEKYKKKQQKITIKCKNGKEHKFDNFKLEYKNNTVFVTGYNIKINENKTIQLQEIENISLSPQKSQGIIFPPTIIFKLKGRLASGYNLKPNEKLLSKNLNEIIISNKGEDKTLLMKRLLKYRNLCEIISPENLKADFAILIKNTLKNYTKEISNNKSI